MQSSSKCISFQFYNDHKYLYNTWKAIRTIIAHDQLLVFIDTYDGWNMVLGTMNSLKVMMKLHDHFNSLESWSHGEQIITGQLCFGPSWAQKLSFDPYKFTI